MRHLAEKLLEEFIVVALVCLVFLLHLRSSLVAIVTLPLGILAAFIVMYYQGVNANIMSLGGIAIAIGAMVDAAVVMIENAHKKLEAWATSIPASGSSARSAGSVIADAAAEVGPALFFSLLIITLSFVPVFALQAQEGRLFSPLAYTKTYAMAAAAALSVTLVPVLMGYLIRGRIPAETRNPINRFLIAALPAAARAGCCALRRLTLALAALAAAVHAWPLYAAGNASSCRRSTRATCSTCRRRCPASPPARPPSSCSRPTGSSPRCPEVQSVHGKIGRAETATDPAPLEMVETVVQLKPRSEWRAGHDAGEAGRGARPAGEAARPRQHLDSADPQPHRHAGHRHQEPARHQGCRATTWPRSSVSRRRSSAW